MKGEITSGLAHLLRISVRHYSVKKPTTAKEDIGQSIPIGDREILCIDKTKRLKTLILWKHLGSSSCTMKL